MAAQSALGTQRLLTSRNRGKELYGAELRSVLGLSLLSAGLVSAIDQIWRQNAVEATCLGLALFGAMIAGGVYGVLIPRLAQKLGLGSGSHGPLVLACTDLTTLTLLFSLTAWLG